MNCAAPLTDQLLEEYTLGRLDEAARSRVEDHYFACPSCLARIEMLQSLRPALQRSARVHSTRLQRAWKGVGAVAATAAAVIVVALVVGRTPRQDGTVPPSGPSGALSPSTSATRDSPGVRARELQQLAQLTAPEYHSPVLRNAPSVRPGFEAAMEAYGRGDYLRAAQRLEPLATARPRDPEVLFFLGVSDLVIGHVEEAVARLEQTAALGDTPYLEQASFCLAKAHLAAGDVGKAAASLDAVIRLRGDLEGPARELQRRLQSLGQ